MRRGGGDGGWGAPAAAPQPHASAAGGAGVSLTALRALEWQLQLQLAQRPPAADPARAVGTVAGAAAAPPGGPKWLTWDAAPPGRAWAAEVPPLGGRAGLPPPPPASEGGAPPPPPPSASEVWGWGAPPPAVAGVDGWPADSVWGDGPPPRGAGGWEAPPAAAAAAAAAPADVAGLVAGTRHVHPAPDLLDDATYGADGAAYFRRLDALLAAAGVGVTPAGGHLLTGDVAAAAAWGAPATVWPVGAFAYVWWPRAAEVYTPADAATLLPPPPVQNGAGGGAGVQPTGGAEAAASAAAAATARVADAKGPLVEDAGLACALAAGHEVLFVAAGGWWEVPAAASSAVARAVFGGSGDGGGGEVAAGSMPCPSGP